MQTVSDHTIDYKTLLEEQVSFSQQQQFKIDTLTHELNNLKRLIYGSKHERFNSPVTRPNQLSLAIEAEQMAEVKVVSEQKIEYTRQKKEVTKKNHPGRYSLPDHLERRDIILDPLGDLTGYRKVDTEITEELEYEPGKYFVNRFLRNIYVKTGTNEFLKAPLPERPMPKAIAGPGLLALVAIDKYVDHLPLNRQQERFRREGVNIPYNTMTDMISGTCSLIKPLYEALIKTTLNTNYLHVDETPVPVLDKDKKGTTHRGYYWVYHNSLEGLVLFDYQPGRGREGPTKMLEGFKGFLQTDGYSVYNVFKDKEGVTLIHCMAHARRKFFESQNSDADRAGYAMKRFAEFYEIERVAKEQQLSDAQRLELRQKVTVPLLLQFENWLKGEYTSGKVLPKSPIGKAIAYSLQRWEQLKIYATDGKLNIDNNPVERSIRPTALGRKNYMFAGSHEAAQRSAMLYSLVGTCKLHDINPFIYLRDVLSRISTHPINRINELLPQNWKLPTNG